MNKNNKWHVLINNFVTKREGVLRIVFIYKDEELLDARIKSFRDKAERVLKRTDFDKEFSKAIITVDFNKKENRMKKVFKWLERYLIRWNTYRWNSLKNSVDFK